jgi:hypothetical protein
VTLTASESQFTPGTLDLEVVQPVLQILGLAASTTTLSVDDPFQVRTGISNTLGTSFQREQAVSAAGSLTVTFTSSDPAVGQLVTTALTGESVTVEMAPNTSRSPATVAAGGVAFNPLSEGMTTVSASSPEFNSSFPLSSVMVTVSSP